MFKRVVLLATLLLAGGCTQDVGRVATPVAKAATALDASPIATMGLAAQRGTARGFGRLPDHGELLAYPGRIVRRDGAYTWYRAELSEEHALRAIAGGRLHVTTPEGEILDFAYDRHVEHASGDWTWIGHRPGHEDEQAILTFGAQAAFGSIAQPGKPPLRLAVRDGGSWLVDTDPEKVAAIVNAATRPRRPDYHIVPESELPRARGAGIVAAADAAAASPGIRATTSAAAPAAATTVDLVIGYTGGFANANGGTSGATTRLNYLVDVANAAYGNSKVSAQVRLVKAMKVTYTDTNSNDTALEQLSGYKAGTGPVTPNSAFNALRAAREQFGADLVSLVRDFRDPEQDGCGLAWLLGGGLQKIEPGEGWDDLAYSVVGDGTDAGSDGNTYYCQDETLAHELGHNMGAAHDKETAKGGDGVLDNPEDYGAYTYSFGYKTGTSAGNFYTVMAYGDSGQLGYRVFSNPKITFCGSRACGNSGADNARTLTATMPTVAGFRATVVGLPDPQAGGLLRQLDANGDGASDLVFFNHPGDKATTWFMNGAARRSYSSTTMDGNLRLVDAGDFDGNGKSDLLFDNAATRQLVLALSTGANYTVQVLANAYGSSLAPLAVADINGDGSADIVLRDKASGKVTIWYMSGATRKSYNSHARATNYAFVGAGDMNGDGKEDLLWIDASRQVLASLSTGVAFDDEFVGLTYQSSYLPAGLQDINGDGDADIVLVRNDANKMVVWYMHGSTRFTYVSKVLDPSYRLVGKGDFDGNGRGDLVFSDPATRRIKMLLSWGTTFAAGYVSNVPQAGMDLMDVQLQ